MDWLFQWLFQLTISNHGPIEGAPRSRASGKLEGSDGSAEEDEMGMDAVQLTEKKNRMFFLCGRWECWALGNWV